MKYEDYLKSDHWQYVRQVAHERADNKCQLCGARDVELHVHHNTYENKGQEKLSDLIVLCKDCHTAFHEKKDNPQSFYNRCAICGNLGDTMFRKGTGGICKACIDDFVWFIASDLFKNGCNGQLPEEFLGDRLNWHGSYFVWAVCAMYRESPWFENHNRMSV